MWSSIKPLWKLKSALLLLFLASVLGLILRFAFVFEMPDGLEYRNVQHAHSHTAMLGWLHAISYIFLCSYFKLNSVIFKKIFWISQILVALMMISFFVSGYGMISIAMSSIFLLLSYYFAFISWKSISRDSGNNQGLSTRLFKAALVFLVLSGLGVWAMAPIMILSLKGSALYYASVQFYLHFQFNGWFIFGMLAIFFRVLENNAVNFNEKYGNRLYLLLLISCVLTYALSVSWSTPLAVVFLTNSAGVLLQFIALIYLLLILKDIYSQAITRFSKKLLLLWGFSFFALGFKILIQTLVAFPYLATISYTIHNFVIGFIHLIMLGVLSIFYIALMNWRGVIFSNALLICFILGIVLTELLLFVQGMFLWFGWGFIPAYHETLAVFSSLLSLSCLGLIIFSQKVDDKEERKWSLGDSNP